MSMIGDTIAYELVNLLGSQKIKERNEGLTKLEHYSTQSSSLLAKLPAKLITVVIDATFKTLNIEKALYVKSQQQPNNAVEERIEKASSHLKGAILILSSERVKSKLKFKSYITIVRNIMDIMVIRRAEGTTEILIPGALDLLKSLNASLELTEFKEHLLSADNREILDFLISSLRPLLSSGPNEKVNKEMKLIEELFRALKMISFPTSSSVPLVICNDSSKYPREIIELIRRFYFNKFLLNKKESFALILIFKIMNQLLIILSTSNIKYGRILSKIVLRFFNGLNFISFETLKEELSISFNLIPHFMNLSKIPRPPGDNWCLSENLELITLPNSSENGTLTVFDDTRQLKACVSKAMDLGSGTNSGYKLLEDDIIIKLFSKGRASCPSWFTLKRISLKEGSPSAKGWLFRTGEVKLLMEFYESRALNMESIVSSSEDSQISKRRKRTAMKTTSFSDYLDSSSSVIGLLLTVISGTINDEMQLLAAQLVVFYLEVSPVSSLFSHISADNVLSHLLDILESCDNKVSYWILLSVTIILQIDHEAAIDSDSHHNVQSLHVNRALRYALDKVKIESLSPVGCSLCCTVISAIASNQAKWSLHALSVKQIETTVQLAEINGPSRISPHSIMFWFEVYGYCITIRMENQEVHRKIQDWAFSKWDQFFDEGSELTAIATFLSWLCGSQSLFVDAKMIKSEYISYAGDLIEISTQWARINNLRSFICLEECESASRSSESHYHPETLWSSSLASNAVLDKLYKGVQEMTLSRLGGQRSEAALKNIVAISFMVISLTGSLSHLEENVRLLYHQCMYVTENEFKCFSPDVLSAMVRFANQHPDPIYINDVLGDALMQKHLQSSSQMANQTTFNNLGLLNGFDAISSTQKRNEGANINYFNVDFVFNEIHESISLIVQLADVKGHSTATTLTNCLSLLEALPSNKALAAGYKFLLDQPFALGSDDHLELCDVIERLIGLFAERLLSSFEFERSEMIVVIGAKLLERFYPYSDQQDNLEFKQDLNDVYKFLSKLIKEGFVGTELAWASFLGSSLRLAKYKLVDSREKLLDELLDQAALVNYSVTVALSADDFVTYLADQSAYESSIAYNKIQGLYPQPQQSLEMAASFCQFMSALSKSSYQVLSTALFNLVELSHFAHTMPFIERALKLCCVSYGLAGSDVLFKAFRLELLRFWASYSIAIESFPYRLFNYFEFSDFLADNYKEVISVELSLTSDSDAALSLVTEVTRIPRQECIIDSFAVTTALGYSRNTVRHNILIRLRDFFSSETSFVTELQRQAPLITYEILKLTDLSSETRICKMLNSFDMEKDLDGLFHTNEPITYCPSHASIPPHIAKDAISTIVVKAFSAHAEQFWSLPTVLFITKRLLLLVENSLSVSERVSHLRRLKLLILFAPEQFQARDMIQLLVSQLCLYFKNEECQTQLCSIFLFNWKRAAVLRDPYVFGPCFISVLSSIVNASSVHLHAQVTSLVKWMQAFLQEVRKAGEKFHILEASLQFAMGESPIFSLHEIENEMEKQNFVFDYDDGTSLFALISSLIANCPSHDSKPKREMTSSIVCNRLISHTSTLSNQFMLWKARYLGQYYAETGALPLASKPSPAKESILSYEANFAANVTKLDNVFLEISQYMPSSLSASCSVDYVLGVLRWRNKYKDDDKTVISFSKHFKAYEYKTMAIDLRTCVLLTKDAVNAKNILHTDDLETITQSLLRYISNDNADISMSIVSLAILNELSVTTSLAPLISTFILRFPVFTKNIFHHLAMYYIYSVKSGSMKIAQLMTAFYSIPRESVPAIFKHAFIDLILLLRVGVKYQSREFINATKGIQYRQLYIDANTVGRSQTALMILESFYSFSSSPDDWMKEKAIIQSIYDSLDATADLTYGLPVEPTLEQGVKLLADGQGNLWTRLQFEMGSLNTSSLSHSGMSGQGGILGSMSRMGFNGLMKMVDESSQLKAGDTDEHTFEWAWKLNQWSLPVQKKRSKWRGKNEIIYKTLKSMHDYPHRAATICEDSLRELVSDKELFMKHSHEKDLIIKTRSWLISLSTIQNIANMVNADRDTLRCMISGGDNVSWYDLADFEDFEDILLGRQSALQFLRKIPETGVSTQDTLVFLLAELANYSSSARSHERLQKSVNSAIFFTKLVEKEASRQNKRLQDFLSKSAKLRLASMFWDQGETAFPVVVLKDIIKAERKRSLMALKNGEEEEESYDQKYPMMSLSVPYISSMIVKWSSESRQESSASLMDNYLEDISSTLTDGSHSGSQKAEIYHHFATFCNDFIREESLAQEIDKYEKAIKTKDDELQRLKEFYGEKRNTKEERSAAKSKYAIIHRIRSHDKEEFGRLVKNRDRFLFNAVKFYLQCISISDKFDDSDVDRLCGLWLEYSQSDPVNMLVLAENKSIASYKFIPWVSQLMSRLADENTEFQRSLVSVLERLTYQHPYHSVYFIKSLRLYINSLNDAILNTRATAAEKLWKRLAANDSQFTKLVLNPIENFCTNAVDLAGEKFPKSSELKLSQIRTGKFWLHELPKYCLPVPSTTISIHQDCNYQSIPYFVSTEATLKIASSGVSKPKIMSFLLSNGERHKILFKGGSDDLRQDAIMIQVFEKVNKIFQSYRDTRKRNLRIRTYKVVPLGPQAGIIEHVLNSVTLNEVIRPLHEKQDRLKLENARSSMKKVEKLCIDEKIKTYYSIMDKVKPVLRSYFFESYLEPNAWFENKITYTRGISTTSMVGHILGLGDRHTNNILLDKVTGEPIHIDFGITFDQGRRLPIPETVPFRLTRDIVDGFGITGVEGCFIKSSEHALRTLKEEGPRIMDVLNILKYDPLYSWTLSPIRKQKLAEQGEMAAYEDIEATDAIEGVKKKLTSSSLSVEATVRELVQQATDPDRLACIYLGWSPFY